MRVPWYQPFKYGKGERNSNFQFLFSFTHDAGNGNSIFSFCFLFSCYTENEIGTSIFIFHYGFVQQNCNCHFCFSIVLSRLRVLLCYLRQKTFKQTLALFRFVFIFSFPLTILKIDVITDYVTNCMFGVVIATNSTKSCAAIFIEN